MRKIPMDEDRLIATIKGLRDARYNIVMHGYYLADDLHTLSKKEIETYDARIEQLRDELYERFGEQV